MANQPRRKGIISFSLSSSGVGLPDCLCSLGDRPQGIHDPAVNGMRPRGTTSSFLVFYCPKSGLV